MGQGEGGVENAKDEAMIPISLGEPYSILVGGLGQ